MFLISETHQPDLEEITGYIRRKEIRQPISKTSIKKLGNYEGSKRNRDADNLLFSAYRRSAN
jgi:hypothetical protein